MLNNVKSTPKIVLATIISVLVLLIAFYLMGGDSSGFSLQQFIGIIVAAAISGVITLLLLKGQSETQKDMLEQQRQGEARRDKDVKIYTSKITAFSTFNNMVWTNDLDDMEKAPEIIERIRKELYSRVILYLDAEEVRNIKAVIPEGNVTNFPVVLSGIIDILNKNAEKTINDAEVSETRGEDYKGACKDLWDEFNKWEGSFNQVIDEGDNTFSSPRRLKMQAWHFSELGEEQLQYIENGGKELSLIEYDEYWRTGLVKQVKQGDVIFLFIGSWKYAGVFIAKGWRVFEYDEQRNVKEITSEGIEKAVVKGEKVPIESVKEQLAKYDIYSSFLDSNSTSCANIVVETISFIPEGVLTPNSTYRKTISRYHWEYAVRLLDKFNEEETEDNKKKIATLYAE